MRPCPQRVPKRAPVRVSIAARRRIGARRDRCCFCLGAPAESGVDPAERGPTPGPRRLVLASARDLRRALARTHQPESRRGCNGSHAWPRADGSTPDARALIPLTLLACSVTPGATGDASPPENAGGAGEEARIAIGRTNDGRRVARPSTPASGRLVAASGRTVDGISGSSSWQGCARTSACATPSAIAVGGAPQLIGRRGVGARTLQSRMTRATPSGRRDSRDPDEATEAWELRAPSVPRSAC